MESRRLYGDVISVDALFFDLDGTLIDSKADLAASVRHIQGLYAGRLSSDDEVGSYIGDGVAKLIERALPQLSGPVLPEAVEAFKTHYRDHCLDTTHLYPGVREVLDHFGDKTLAVITNKPERISRRILDGLEIVSRFRLVLGGDSLPFKKPDPSVLRFALRELKVTSPDRAVMVGDSVMDIQAAQNAGLWSCAFLSNIADHRTLRGAGASLEITSLPLLIEHFR
jgi:phosphoglycolate phosphatase